MGETRSLTEILEENEAWRAAHLHVYDGYCQPCAERDAERTANRLADSEAFREAAYTYAHANLTGEACDRDEPCQKRETHGVNWTCRVHKTARLVMAAHDRLFGTEKEES